jgi:hypothetical protein
MSNKIKVIFFFNDLSLTGAPIIFNKYLQCSLIEKNLEVISLSRYGGDLNINSNKIVIRNSYPNNIFESFYYKFIDIFKIAFYLIKFKPNIVITNTFINSLPILISSILKIYTIAIIHENAGANIKFLKFRSFILSKCNILIAVSKSTYNFCINNQINESKIKLVTNGLDLSKFKLKNILEGSEKITLGALANWSNYKNLPTIINFFRILNNSSEHKYELLIGGDCNDAYTFNYKKLIKENPDITFLGKVHNSHEFYSKIDGFLFFSENESFPTVLMETLFFQIPVFTITKYEVAIEVQGDALFHGIDNENLISLINVFFDNNYPNNYKLWNSICLESLKKIDINLKWNEIKLLINKYKS